MADIYDLVQQGLARGRRDKSQFDDPLIDMALQIPKMIQSERDRAKVQNRDSLNTLIGMFDKLETPTGIANFQSSLNDISERASNDPELQMNIGLLKGLSNNLSDDYGTFKTAIDQGAELIESELFPQGVDDYVDLQGLAKKSGYDDKLGYLSAEKEKILSYLDKISLGYDGDISTGKKKFSYKGKDVSVIRKLKAHNEELDIAIQTLGEDGIITKAEAMHIMTGDKKAYAKDKAAAMSEAKTVITKMLAREASVEGLLSSVASKQLSSSDMSELLELGVDISSFTDTDEGYEKIKDSLDYIMNTSTTRLALANQKYQAWAGRPFGDFSRGELFEGEGSGVNIFVDDDDEAAEEIITDAKKAGVSQEDWDKLPDWQKEAALKEAELGLYDDKEDEKGKEVIDDSEVLKQEKITSGMELLNTVLKIKPPHPGRNFPNQEDFEKVAKDLPNRHKGYLKNIYRKNHLVNKLKEEMANYTISKRNETPHSKKTKGRLKRYVNQIKNAEKGLNNAKTIYENYLSKSEKVPFKLSKESKDNKESKDSTSFRTKHLQGIRN